MVLKEQLNGININKKTNRKTKPIFILINWSEFLRRFYLGTIEMKKYNVIIDGQNFFGQPGWNDLVTYDSLQKIATGQADDCTTVCLLDYNYFKKY